MHAIAEVQKQGGVACFIDAEHAFDAVYATVCGTENSMSAAAAKCSAIYPACAAAVLVVFQAGLVSSMRWDRGCLAFNRR
jgi:RecA/RadA recombinase